MVVDWEPAALTDLDSQFHWYVKEMGPSAAKKFRDGIFADVMLISRNPMIGKLDEQLCAMSGEQIWRSILSGRKYRIVYSIEEQALRIYLIWKCSRSIGLLNRIKIKK